MTKSFCDHCESEIGIYRSQHLVKLSGVGPKCGIALPASCFNLDFCSKTCLLDWLKENYSSELGATKRNTESK